ncbi:hypothetical protein AWN90_35045 [Nocardia terpenica]|uniref:3'-5' exoribonuclease Rv2179c-like domain-containing protein n=1 Tax=Nocardia terpenica TaxID=455432 RepID=A0A164MY64_9NOCA|nr:hypothetical protein AWN90_35045 [Nocardia terpenica]
MRYFYDCEFVEDGITIDLISIGVVCEDGREYYAVSTEFDPDRAGPWVRRHVLPKLPEPSSPLWRSRERIREDLYAFLVPRPTVEPQLWAWVSAYDHVALCQLWGSMVDLPTALPRYTNELRQHWDMAGISWPWFPGRGRRRGRGDRVAPGHGDRVMLGLFPFSWFRRAFGRDQLAMVSGTRSASGRGPEGTPFLRLAA